MCEWLLDKGIISEDMCKAGLRASRHVSSAVIRGHVDTPRAMCETMEFSGLTANAADPIEPRPSLLR